MTSLAAVDAETISALLLELAVEVDLHYEDEDLHALTPTFDRMNGVRELLLRCGYPVHPDVDVVIARYNRQRN